MTHRTHKALIILAATLVGSAALAAEKAYEKHLAVTPGGQLTLEADTGSVTITGRGGNEAIIRAAISGSDDFVAHLEISASQTPSGMEITAHRQPRSGLTWFRSLQEHVHFTIEVPRNYSMQLHTSGGDIDVRGVQGAVSGATSGGNITVRDVSGSVNLHTSGGNVDAEGLTGATELETSGGDIALRKVDGSIKAETSGGRVNAELRSNKGISLRTSGGDIVLLLANDLGASVDASTSGGRVSSDVPLKLADRHDDSSLRGAINGGGAPVSLHTSGGNIHIGRLQGSAQ